MRMALCDDNAGFRDLIETLVGADPDLELAVVAPDVDTLLGALPGVPVDAVLLDWVMPGCGQEDAVRRVRAALPDVCLLVVSAVIRSSAEARALEAGADGYVEKGPGGRELLERCRALAARA